MIETPGEFCEREQCEYGSESLSRFSFHTGADLRPLAEDEICPILFRDIGLIAMIRFLRGELERLAGPLSPITYARTEQYVEPYTDYENVGRLVLLRPLSLKPWHSGIRTIYVSRADQSTDFSTVGFVPGGMTLTDAAELMREVQNVQELREVLGGSHYDELIVDTAHRLDHARAEMEESEKIAAPLRAELQSLDYAQREEARAKMAKWDITEHDLCAAWHHVPRERRALLREVLTRLNER